MKKDELKDFFEKNGETFSLPIIVDKGCDTFPTLFKRWDSFFKLLENAPKFQMCIAPAKRQADLLKKAISSYYAGKYQSVGRYIRKILKEIQDNSHRHLISELSELYIDEEARQWYRARKGTPETFDREDLKHIPFTNRGAITNQRYSVNGIPCLYLANSLYTCWEELNRPALDTFWCNRYYPVRPVKLLNLSTTIFEVVEASTNIKYVAEDNSQYEEVVIDFLSNWILQSACSVQVKEENRTFHEEYIIPQLLMLYSQDYRIDGIMYFSTKVERAYWLSTGWISKCIAIPAFDCKNTTYSRKIDEMFATSQPINIGLYEQGVITSYRQLYHMSDNWFRGHSYIFPTKVGAPYQNSVFYRCEIELTDENRGLGTEIERLMSDNKLEM